MHCSGPRGMRPYPTYSGSTTSDEMFSHVPCVWTRAVVETGLDEGNQTPGPLELIFGLNNLLMMLLRSAISEAAGMEKGTSSTAYFLLSVKKRVWSWAMAQSGRKPAPTVADPASFPKRLRYALRWPWLALYWSPWRGLGTKMSWVDLFWISPSAPTVCGLPSRPLGRSAAGGLGSRRFGRAVISQCWGAASQPAPFFLLPPPPVSFLFLKTLS